MISRLVPWLIALALVDAIIPIPITGIIVIYALVAKPPWFRRLCAEVTAEPTPPPT